MKSNVKTGIIKTFLLFIYIMLLAFVGIEAGLRLNRMDWDDLPLTEYIFVFGYPTFVCSVIFGVIGGAIYKKDRILGIVIGALTGGVFSSILWARYG